MSGHLYQLQTTAKPGQLIRIDGPYDTWGRVVALQKSGYHLIRGLGRDKPKGIK